MKSIILAGGTGTRLYPISTPECPKQFVPLFNSETQSLFQLTIARCQQLSPDQDIYVVANWKHRALVESQLDNGAIRVIYESESKNTLPALALGLRAIIEDGGAEDTVGIFPADHIIGDASTTLKLAAQVASEGNIIILGIRPDTVSTEYGYIWPGAAVGPDTNSVQAFIEKPAYAIAKSYCQRGFLWNSGIIVASVDKICISIQQHAPQITKQILHAPSSITAEEMYAGIIPLSIDYGLLEYLRDMIVIKSDIMWTDCGSISSLRRVLMADNFI